MTTGVNKDGEKYIVLNVLTNEKKKRKVSFVAKIPELIDTLMSMKFTEFQQIKLHFKVDKIFNPERRISYWNVELCGVGN